MPRVIVKIIFKTLDFLKHVERYIEYYNRFLASKNNNDFYLELLQDGVIIIYKDLDIYCKRCCPLTQKEQDIIKSLELPNDPFILKLFYPRQSFPKEGLCFIYKIILGDPSIIYSRGVQFFKSISPSIESNDISQTEGEICMPQYEALVDYLKTMAWKYILPK